MPDKTGSDALVLEARVAVQKLLPAESGLVDVMGIGLTPRGASLAKKIQEAAAKHGPWFQAQMKLRKPGEPLPYHPNLGMTESEWEEFLRLNKKKTLVKTGQAALSVKKLGDGKYRFSAKGTLQVLNAITIDLKKSRVETPRGTCDLLDRVKTPKGHSFPWDGYVWEGLRPIVIEQSKGRVTRFHIGKLRGTNTGIIYYSANGFENGKLQTPIKLFINYPLGKN